MLLLLHGQILLFIPAAFCLVIVIALAVLMKIAWVRHKRVIFFLLILMILFFGAVGILSLVGFLEEFYYVVKYSGSGPT